MCESTTVTEIRKLFGLFCSVPHGSGHEQQLSDKLCEWLYAGGLSPEQDAHGNIVCDIAGTQNGPLVALQAHLDMVCAVGSPDYQPLSDPIRPIERDGWLCTAGESSLGADCGAGAAVMLRIARHDELPHPPLRLIFTVCEEVGLTGANQIDPACMDGVSYFINLDGFCFGRAVIGSAGGARLRMTRPIETEAVSAEMRAFRLTLSGLTGGHSGADIDKKRANAIEQLGLALRGLAAHAPLRLFDVHCGTASNAIPADAACAFVTDRDPQAWLAQANAQLTLSCGANEPEARFTLTPCDLPEAVWTEALTQAVIGLACSCPNGVHQYHAHFPSLVGDSMNLGVLRTEKGQVTALAMVRFSNPGADAVLVGRYAETAAACGFDFAEPACYPVWPVRTDSDLIEKARACYEAVTGEPLTVEAYHVGLEPAVFHGYNPETQFITLGMTIENCHSPSERWKLDTIRPFSELMERLLISLSEN
ncbi:MAG: M20/M25/M40 family metallo-hydrolase [Butyricicoccus sp.]|nr:M20/M25/M40 family metallo-hydrolase [Butyricicoccus sp.]